MTVPARAEHEALFQSLPRLRLPSVARVVALMMMLVLIGAGVFLFVTPWVQTTSGPGIVTALDPQDREQSINALVSGRILEWYVRDGQSIKAGEPIARIVDNDPQLVQRLESELEALRRRLAAAEIATRTALLDYERKKQLYEDGLASRLDYETAKIKVEELRAREQSIAAEVQRAEVNLSRQSSQVVRAPRDGQILNIQAGGEATFVKEGDPLATFVPDEGVRSVELFVDGRDVPLVWPGRKVRLQFEGWPAVQFSGWPSVAVGTFAGEVAVVDASAQPDGRFRVLVVEDPDEPNWPDERYIRFGAKARGWVLLDEVKVGYELWRQLNNFPPEFRPRQSAEQ